MRRSRLVNIRWRLTLFGATVAGAASMVATAVVLQSLQLDILTLVTLRWLQIPVLLLILAIAAAAGLLAGWPASGMATG